MPVNNPYAKKIDNERPVNNPYAKKIDKDRPKVNPHGLGFHPCFNPPEEALRVRNLDSNDITSTKAVSTNDQSLNQSGSCSHKMTSL